MNPFLPLIRNNDGVRMPSWDLFDRIFADLNAPLGTMTAETWTPAIDVAETPQEIVVHAEVPGMEKKDLDITLSDGLLTIRGEKHAAQKEEKASYLRLERRYGSFCRTLRIPDSVQIEAIDASYKDGLLTVKLPKRLPETPKRIKIQADGPQA